MFYIGEGEIGYDRLLDIYKECRKKGFDRAFFLKMAASLPGLYVPGLYDVSYNEDGTIRAFDAICGGIPSHIKKVAVEDFTKVPYPDKPLVPYIKVTQDRVVLEIQRGCIRGCRFCQAGMIYRPVRERSLEELKATAVKMLESTGHEEISLSSLSSSDYSRLPELIDFLIDYTGKNHINISLPSLRIDSFSLDVMSKVQDVRKSSLTFAPEAGSQRLRDVINKGLYREDILEGARKAFLGGWSKVKLYFMLGHPTERDEDIRGIAELSNDIAKLYYDTIPKELRSGRKVQITCSTSFFVPKPFTPFQWAKMSSRDEFLEKAHKTSMAMKEQLNCRSIRYNWHDADVSVLEGLFARGDRRLCDLVVLAYKKGALFDAWTDSFKVDIWNEAIDELKIDLDFYVTRERGINEVLPWDFIDTGVKRSFLESEWERAKQGEVTPNCRTACSGCGASVFKGGVCYEG